MHSPSINLLIKTNSMKKSLLIGASVLVGLTAVAVSRENAVVTKSLEIKDLVNVVDNAPKMMEAKSVKGQGPAKVLSPDGNYNFYPILSMPSIPFYMNGLIFTLQDGTTENIAPFPLPANSTQTYEAVTYVGKAVSTAPAFSNFQNFKYDWTYVDFVDGTYKNSTDKTVSLTYPAQIRLGGKVLPGFNMHYDALKDTMESAPYELIIGGQGLMPLNSSEGFGIQNIGFNTCALISNMRHQTAKQFSTNQYGNFGSMTYSNTVESFTELSEAGMLEDLSTAFEKAFGQKLASVNTTGIGYALPYAGSPYLLKKLDLYSWARIEGATQFTIEVYETNENGLIVGDPIYTKTCNMEPTLNESSTGRYRAIVSATFTSKDADGFDLDYVVVDKPLFVKISGFLNNDNVKAFGAWTGEYLYSYTYGQHLPCTAFNVVDLVGENGSKLSNYQYPLDGHAWGNDGVNFYYGKNFYVEVEAEYPYLQPSSLILDNKSVDIEYKSDGNYSIEIPTGTKNATAVVLTSSNDADMIVFDEDAVPEGVKVKIADGIELIDQTAAYNFIEVQMEFDETFVNKSFTLPVIYKNLSMNLNFYNGTASVGEVVVDTNAETVYYDLQGRKVMGTPDKGIYIVKEGNKARKVVL